MVQINLLPWRENAQQKRKKLFLGLLYSTLFAFICTVLLIQRQLSIGISSHQQRHHYLQTHTQLLTPRIIALQQLKKEHEKVMQGIHSLQVLALKRNDVTRLFNILAQVVPTGVYLKSAVFKEGKVQLQGETRSHHRVALMINNIKKMRAVNGASLHSIAQSPGTLYHFSLEFMINSALEEVSR